MTIQQPSLFPDVAPTVNPAADLPQRQKRHCRSCGAAVFFAPWPSGRKGIFDWESTERANVVIDAEGIAGFVPAGQGTFVDHHATCPDAASFRRR